MNVHALGPDLFGNHGPLAQAGDAVMTPDWCAADMVRYFRPTGTILEPCRGAGAFMRALPPDAFWCEITEGQDFFAWQNPVDWILTNPPYSLTREFLQHSFSIADHVVFLLPARNIFSGYGTLRECAGWGGIAAIRWYGTGTLLNFPMGNAIAAIYWRKGHQGVIVESYYEDEQKEIANANVSRGSGSAEHHAGAPGERTVRACRAALSAFAREWHGGRDA